MRQLSAVSSFVFAALASVGVAWAGPLSTTPHGTDSVKPTPAEGPLSGRPSITSGKALESSTASLIHLAPGGSIHLVSGTTDLPDGNVGRLDVSKGVVGHDFSGTFSATAGTLPSRFAKEGAFFGLLYNVKLSDKNFLENGFTGQAKGDVSAVKGAPTVAEPAALALLAVGLAGLMGAARSRMRICG